MNFLVKRETAFSKRGARTLGDQVCIKVSAQGWSRNQARRRGTWPHSPDCLSWQVWLIFSNDKTRPLFFFLFFFTKKRLTNSAPSCLYTYFLRADHEVLEGSDPLHDIENVLKISVE